MEKHLQDLVQRYPSLNRVLPELKKAFTLWREAYSKQKKTLICGNGGSAADGEHIVGELMKGFVRKRPVHPEFAELAKKEFGDQGEYLADHLQGALPAISLTSQQSLVTAVGNDLGFDLVFAQQVYGYGKAGDVLLALSTSGNSENILQAVRVARLLSLVTICMTGQEGGALQKLCDVAIRVPEQQTHLIQEYHVAIYHTLCLMLEDAFFGSP